MEFDLIIPSCIRRIDSKAYESVVSSAEELLRNFDTSHCWGQTYVLQVRVYVIGIRPEGEDEYDYCLSLGIHVINSDCDGDHDCEYDEGPVNALLDVKKDESGNFNVSFITDFREDK